MNILGLRQFDVASLWVKKRSGPAMQIEGAILVIEDEVSGT
jgi:hypothetical protein